MEKEKKISFSYFLNKRLKSRVYPDGIERFYPYVRINFNSNNHQCVVGVTYGDGRLTEDEFERFFVRRESININENIEAFEDRITEVIRLEYKYLKEKFVYKGLSQRSHKYYFSFLSILQEEIVRKKFVSFLQKNLKEREVSSVYSDYFMFSDSYKLVKENFFPDLINKMPNDLRLLLIGFMHLDLFDEWNSVSKKLEWDVIVLDWFKGNLPIKFKEFLMENSGENKFKKRLTYLNENESMNSSYVYFLRDLDYDDLEVSKILQIISSELLNWLLPEKN